MPGQRVTAATVIAVQQWVDAVQRHVPGSLDAAAGTVIAFGPEDRRQLRDGLAILLRALTGKGVMGSTAEVARLAGIGSDLARNPGANVFLKRAAVLHADAVIFGPPIDLAAAEPVPAGQPGLVAAIDGEYRGVVASNWHWTQARSVLDLVAPAPAADAFVGAWYHAVAAHMLRNAHFGEADIHLARATALLPDDARLLFDRGCLAEALGLPRSRHVMDDPRYGQPTGTTRSAGVNVSPRLLNVVPGQREKPSIVLTKAQTEADAERLFHRAIDRDPTLAEARVRLGRLLEIRARHAEALEELTTALRGDADPATAFYAHLFAARSARALGRLDLADAHVRDAVKLFPDAQSALVAQSQLALVRNDPDGALAPLRRLAALDPRNRADPWWEYHTGSGRNADALLAEMWAAARR